MENLKQTPSYDLIRTPVGQIDRHNSTQSCQNAGARNEQKPDQFIYEEVPEVLDSYEVPVKYESRLCVADSLKEYKKNKDTKWYSN
jgi:hypothetical protein